MKIMSNIKKPNRMDYFYFSRGKLEFDKNRYVNNLERYCNELEKALDNACEYIHDCGGNGCPNNYDGIEMNECKSCKYECMDLDFQLNSSKSCWKEYLKKSTKCWKEYFLKGDTENDEN